MADDPQQTPSTPAPAARPYVSAVIVCGLAILAFSIWQVSTAPVSVSLVVLLAIR